MNLRGDDHLEGAHLRWRFIRQIGPISRYFFDTLLHIVSIHWVGVQTWLKAAMNVRSDDILEGAFWGKSLPFHATFWICMKCIRSANNSVYTKGWSVLFPPVHA